MSVWLPAYPSCLSFFSSFQVMTDKVTAPSSCAGAAGAAGFAVPLRLILHPHLVPQLLPPASGHAGASAGRPFRAPSTKTATSGAATTALGSAKSLWCGPFPPLPSPPFSSLTHLPLPSLPFFPFPALLPPLLPLPSSSPLPFLPSSLFLNTSPPPLLSLPTLPFPVVLFLPARTCGAPTHLPRRPWFIPFAAAGASGRAPPPWHHPCGCHDTKPELPPGEALPSFSIPVQQPPSLSTIALPAGTGRQGVSFNLVPRGRTAAAAAEA